MEATAECEDGATPRVVGRKDLFHEKADGLSEEVENGGQRCDGHYDSGTGGISCVGHSLRIIGFSRTFGFQAERKPKTRIRAGRRVDEGGS